MQYSYSHDMVHTPLPIHCELPLRIIILFVSRHSVLLSGPRSFSITDMAISSRFQDFFYSLNV